MKSIEISNLSKSFHPGFPVLNQMNLSVCAGQVYGLLGENGCGKSTTFNILAGLEQADSGSAHVLGAPFRYATPSHRSRVAIVSQSGTTFPSFTLAEHFDYFAQLYPKWDAKLAGYLAAKFGLPLFYPVRFLSGGQQRKAAILLAMATRAEVLLFDEPAAGLDPVARRAFIEELADVLAEREETTVLFSTHIMSDLERIADDIGFLHSGRIMLEENVAELTETVRKVQVIFRDDQPVPSDFTLPGQIGRLQREGSVVSGMARFASVEERETYRRQTDKQVGVFSLNLEDLFIELIRNQS
ncbi:ABC transporter ATP-binding protein [Verrucomicrobiaceae bacterium N1E253]|uniref:ABC transporter ATP-binding protein n=1 Tax=Oceaniferula marina TaxID=2748318 RepID=A0A851GDU3_9BACT|nr:ABC transporter ATP-binding protein [Oceaniferula marina]NWK55723.1 ABC transporter ATP-binding protein [Oceaniferula marina]